MPTNIVTKNLALLEDMEVGVNKVNQTRNNTIITGSRVFLPVAVDTDSGLANIDVTKYNYAVKVTNNEPVEYSYDPSGIRPGVQSTNGPGTWFQSGLVGGLWKPVTWSGFAGGADASGTNASDAAFNTAGNTGETVYVPKGTYLLNTLITVGTWVLSDGVVFTGVGGISSQVIQFSPLIMDYGLGKGKRWVSDTPPVKVHRFRDRVFVGGSANNSGGISNQDGNTSSWLDDPTQTGLIVGHASLEQNSTLAVATESGLGAAVFASRASDYGLPTGGTIGLTSLVLNDKDTTVIGGRPGGLAHYSVAILSENANSNSGYSLTGTESNIWNQKLDASSIDPYNFFPTNLVKNQWLSNGFPENEHTRQNFDATCAIGILNNSVDPTKGKYKVGIAFKSTSLFGTDGVTGRGIAMSLARGHSFQWFYGAGSQGPYISSSVDANTNEVQAMVFSNFGTQFLNRANQQIHLIVDSIPVVNNYVRLTPAISGSGIALAAAGSDADVDIILRPKGAGTTRITTTIKPTSDNLCDFGSAANRGRTAYFGTGTINTSDSDHKPIKERITDELLDAWEAVDWGGKFKFDDAIAEKGEDGARWHFGVVAQQVQQALADKGIDGFTLGLLCYDEWDDVYEQVLQNEGATTTKVREVEKPVMTTRLVKRVVDGVEQVSEEAIPKFNKVYLTNADGSQAVDEKGQPAVEYVPVTELVTEEYEAPDEPIYARVQTVKAGKRYGIRYEEALSLEVALQRRTNERFKQRLAKLEALLIKDA